MKRWSKILRSPPPRLPRMTQKEAKVEAPAVRITNTNHHLRRPLREVIEEEINPVLSKDNTKLIEAGLGPLTTPTGPLLR